MQAFGPATIGRGKFAAVLKAANSPVLAERPADDYYGAIVGYGLDPAFMLAIFQHESRFGTAADAIVRTFGTKNWGNTRSNSGVRPGPVIQTPRGPFVKFASWLDGLHDACNRLVDPDYPYAPQGARTVETIIPLWAPNGDHDNNSAAYVAAVVAAMAAWKETVPVAYQQFADRMVILPPGDNRDGRRLSGFHAFVWHETANEQPGAGVQNTVDWSHGKYNNGIRPDASFHFVTDQYEAAQLLPAGPNDAEVGYHIGDGANDPDDEALFTVAGEVCVNSRSGYPTACKRMAKVAAKVIRAHGKTVIDGVTLRQHGSYWSQRNPDVHQNCPYHAKRGDWGVTWPQIVAMVKAEYDALAGAGKVPVVVPVDESAALKQYGEGIDFACRGDLLREGVADLREFGGGDAERVCLYERMVTHRLKGANYVLALALWDRLRREGKLHIYPDMPF